VTKNAHERSATRHLTSCETPVFAFPRHRGVRLGDFAFSFAFVFLVVLAGCAAKQGEFAQKIATTAGKEPSQFGSSNPQQGSEFVRLDLDRGVHVEVPSAWLPADPNLRQAYMAQRKESRGHVGLVARSALDSLNLLEIEASKATFGPRLLISSRMPPVVRPQVVSRANDADLRVIDSATKKVFEAMVASGGQRLINVRPARKTAIGGKPALYVEAMHTTRENRDMLVRQYLVSTDEQTLTFSLHLPADEQTLLSPLLERIKGSIAID